MLPKDFGDLGSPTPKKGDKMIVQRNEMSVLRNASAADDAYKKDVEPKESALPRSGSNLSKIPDDDAAAATIQYPIREKGKKEFSIEESESLKKFKEAMEEMKSPDTGNKYIMEESALLKKLRETIERLRESDPDKNTILTEDSELLKKIKEAIATINASEWSLAGIREIISKFSTTTQFDLHAIQGVEENIKEQNMNLEIGVFSLVRTMEDARKALLAQGNVDANTATGLLDLLDKQKEDREKEATQSVDLNANNSLDIEV